MANEEHVRIMNQGVEVWNNWRNRNRAVKPDLSDTNLEGVVMRLTRKLEVADFTDVKLWRSTLASADLRGANFKRADLRDARLDDANLQDADFSEAQLSRACLRRANLVNAQLISANLVSAIMTEAAMDQVLCAAANLSGAILERAVMRFADLKGANLNLANLMFADLSDASFQDATLVWADLRYSNLNRVDLRCTDLREATFGRTTLCDVDLSQARDLHTVLHEGPSHIGIDTIYRSGGAIPESFLRGCGIPDRFILHARSLINQPIEFYSCFIGHSSQDQAFVESLYAQLQEKGVRCWFAPEDMKIGDRIRPRIDESIRLHDKLLLVLSEDSVASSWVEQEVETALEHERKSGRTVLFPIRLDNAVMEIETGWPALIRNTRHIADFSRSKDHDAYQAAFERLLRDLKAEGG